MRQPAILAFILCILLLASASPEPRFVYGFRPGKDYALLIAINNYQNPKLADFSNPQGNPQKDAGEIEQLLKNNYGFSTERLNDPTSAEIIAKLEQYERDFRSGVKDPNGQLFLFFSGHGEREYGNGFFLAADADPNKLYEKTIPYVLWRPRIANFNCQHIMVVIDACYSGTFDPNWFNRPKSYGGRPGEMDATAKLQANYDTKKTRMFFTSATEVQSPEVSSFAKKLKEGLLSGGGPDGILTSTELFSSLEQSSPRPHRGEFEQDEAGSTYLFFSQVSNTPNSDTDQDGIPDTQDECPDLYSKTPLGCPDADEDGISDPEDNCPYESGPASNNGCPLPPPMVLVQGGTFQMGDVMRDKEQNDETVHTVTLSSFLLAKNELTFDEFDAFCKMTNRRLPFDQNKGRGKHPVINVDWYDAVEYCNWRSGQEGLQAVYSINKNSKDPNNRNKSDTIKWLIAINRMANGYRLPTEAEWEYAARQGGQKIRFGNGNDFADSRQINFNAYSNDEKPYFIKSFNKNYRELILPVGSFSPNSIDLFDMSGNVWEWCQDWYGRYPRSASNDPQGPKGGSFRVIRGGSWEEHPVSLRVASRHFYTPSYYHDSMGFRLARTAP